MTSTGKIQSFSLIVKEFKEHEKKGVESIESFLFNNPKVPETVRAVLQSQTNKLMPDVFQWLYDCVSLKKKSSKVFVFVMQFVPDLVLLYLLCTSENIQKLKAPVEVLLRRISKELEADKDTPLQIPTLTRPSIYHQSLSMASQSRLTESALTKHDHDQISSTFHAPTVFSDQEITSANRLPFLTYIIRACTNRITQFNSQSQTTFCLVCTRLMLSGMTEQCITQVSTASNQGGLTREDLHSLRKAKRVTINDDFLFCLLQGIRMCLFQPCHYSAKQALQAAKIRAEYNLLPQSLQVSQALERLSNEIHPLRLPLDTEIHKTYSSRDGTNWPCKPSTVMRTLIGQALYHNLNPPSAADNPHNVSDERLSLDLDELLISQSYDQGPLESPPGRESPDNAPTFEVGNNEYFSDEDVMKVPEIDESPSLKMKLPTKNDDDLISPSDVSIVIQRETPERTIDDEQTELLSSRISTVSTTSSVKATEV